MELTCEIINKMDSKEYLFHRKEIRKFYEIERPIKRLLVYKFNTNDPIYQHNYYLKNIEKLKIYKKEYYLRKKYANT